ncbi:imidazole glycerol phosphate synthase subunit HisH [Tessaracoccus sp. ZS01]|uniref:imidazole glycerol phosphate synthase subunit HisH n=1 Tax=Tessaracoccus sp. ZS01 TaxID=1906324 RepID=UPI0018E9A55F|nr:imidazole glycerol phosphate synthase subunit HisH [Tessaracoccus sp. ZS01]
MIRRVGLLDYGSGNLHSAARAFRNAGAEVVVSADHSELLRQDGLVVPGVGAFATCMNGLTAVGGDDLIRDWAAAERPLLGICVGHQILFSAGHEHGIRAEGIGLYDGEVTALETHRLPHMGWNTVSAAQGSRLFEGLAEERFYFVHSYAARTAPGDGLVTTAQHEDVSFVAAVERGVVSSTQFHPEKSGAAGARLIGNWLAAFSG